MEYQPALNDLDMLRAIMWGVWFCGGCLLIIACRPDKWFLCLALSLGLAGSAAAEWDTVADRQILSNLVAQNVAMTTVLTNLNQIFAVNNSDPYGATFTYAKEIGRYDRYITLSGWQSQADFFNRQRYDGTAGSGYRVSVDNVGNESLRVWIPPTNVLHTVGAVSNFPGDNLRIVGTMGVTNAPYVNQEVGDVWQVSDSAAGDYLPYLVGLGNGDAMVKVMNDVDVLQGTSPWIVRQDPNYTWNVSPNAGTIWKTDDDETQSALSGYFASSESGGYVSLRHDTIQTEEVTDQIGVDTFVPPTVADERLEADEGNTWTWAAVTDQLEEQDENEEGLKAKKPTPSFSMSAGSSWPKTSLIEFTTYDWEGEKDKFPDSEFEDLKFEVDMADYAVVTYIRTALLWGTYLSGALLGMHIVRSGVA